MNSIATRILSKFVFFIALMLLTLGCQPATATPSPSPRTGMVIASHVGEVTKEVRCAGEQIKYRIYYQNASPQSASISVLDRLNPNLSQVTIASDASYSEAKHSISWKMDGVPSGQGGFVEFSAVVGETDSITNQAEIQVEGQRPIKTNVVETSVCILPKPGWIPFSRDAKVDERPSATMKDETTMGLTVNFIIPGMNVYELVMDNVMYYRFSIPDYDSLLDLGKPELPILGQVLEVPYGVNFEVEVVKTETITLEGYNVYPAQKPVVEQQPVNSDFVLDQQAYQKDADYPGYLSRITTEDIGIIRGHRLVFLKVNPVQYNPVTRAIQAYSQIEVRINYDHPAQINLIDERLLSPSFEALIKEAVLNYKDPGRFLTAESTDESYYKEPRGYDYLIITEDGFYNPSDVNNPIVQLQNWKQQKGLLTKVVKISSIGNTAAQIQAYLQTAYDTWSPAPSFVLLVGDANLITPDYRTLHDGHRINVGTPNEQATLIGTDLYYATLDGGAGDIFPDIMLGRISADTTNEVSIMVDKILDYEKNPPNAANFYTDTSLVRLFEDAWDPTPDPDPGDGQEDPGWILIEEADDLLTYFNNNQYVPDQIYNASGNHPQGPLLWEDGTNLPVNLTFNGGFLWNGDNQDVENAFNNGNFLITYRGHGGRDGWAEPNFQIGDFPNLNNGNLTPVIFGPTCQTGWFDDETDNAGLATNTDSFAESILRQNNAGAVAIIASARNSWGAYNNPMVRGMIDALWPDFDASISSAYMPRMGQILTYSKVFLARNVSAHLITFEMTHLFGDPEMPVWTEEPQPLKVEHPLGIGAVGEQDFIVRVFDNGTPVNNAVVSLTRDNKIIDVKQTNPGGYSRFNLNPAGAGDLEITVTALRYRPYLGKIIVSADGGVINRLDPQNGVENETLYVGGQNFSGNEQVDLFFGSQQVLTTQAASGSWGQSGVQDVGMSVPAGYSLGPENILAHGITSDRYAADVFYIRTQNPIDLYLYSQWDQTTWNLTPGADPIWNNPDIQFYDSSGNPVDSNNLRAGTDYVVKAKIHNDTDYPANNVQVTFKWANFGVGQPDRVWEEANTSPAIVDIPAHSMVEAEINWSPPGTGHLCMLVDVYHVEDINTDNNYGQENLHVGSTSSPAEVPFLVYNPTDEPAMIFLEVRQLVDPSQKERLWGVWIRQPEPQLILPGEAGEAWVIIDPAMADVPIGEQAEFSLTAFLNGKIIGGVNFIIIHK